MGNECVLACEVRKPVLFDGSVRQFSGLSAGAVELAVDRLKGKLSVCGSPAMIKVSCRDCGAEVHVAPMILHCFGRYCMNVECVAARYKKAYSRLSEYELPDKLRHAVIGFPRCVGFRRGDKKRQEYIMHEFLRDLKKAGIVLAGLKVFDLQDGSDKFVHYHLALWPVYMDFRKIQRIVRKTMKRLGCEFVFHEIGFRSRESLMHYFAKRVAGLYGVARKYIEFGSGSDEKVRLWFGFMLAEKINPMEYVVDYSNFTVLSTVGKVRKSELGSSVVPLLDGCPDSCPVCGWDLFRFSVEIISNDEFLSLTRKAAECS